MASTIKVNNIQNQCGANIVNKCSTTITLGASGDTIQLACGASQTGFGRTGTVDWDTTAKTANFTAVSGNGYFVNTTSGAITVTLPATPTAGDIVAIKDYANTALTNNITIARNGSNIDGEANDPIIINEGGSVTLVYVDATKGWLVTDAAQKSDIGVPSYIVATGGTVTCCGDYKIHTFTGPGTFTVCSVGNAAGSNSVEYIVVAGGGGGGSPQGGGGGGAGGFRFASPSLAPVCYPAKPLAASNLPVSTTAYPITVGSGGSGAACAPCRGTPGNNSIFSIITSAGGGGGGTGNPVPEISGGPGGSGGGGGGRAYPQPNVGGTGNTPPVSPPQGNDGGRGRPTASPPSSDRGGGGGGAISAGTDGAGDPGNAGPGGTGAGLPSAFGSNGEPCGSFRYYAGGGGGGLDAGTGSTGSGGLGGGGAGSPGPGPAVAGTANTGGGGGGSGTSPGQAAAGGSGIVIIRYRYQ